jgi:hypothetical protein
MTVNEKEALLSYLEFGLINMCDKIEGHVTDVGIMYEEAYLLLIDIDDAIETHQLLTTNTHP